MLGLPTLAKFATDKLNAPNLAESFFKADLALTTRIAKLREAWKTESILSYGDTVSATGRELLATEADRDAMIARVYTNHNRTNAALIP